MVLVAIFIISLIYVFLAVKLVTIIIYIDLLLLSPRDLVGTVTVYLIYWILDTPFVL